MNKRKSELARDIYIPFVGTLFRDGLTLTIGFSAQIFLVLLVYWKTSDNTYLVIAGLFLLVAFLRMRNIRKYRYAPPPRDIGEARHRENDYILYASMHGLMLGLFCFAGIYWAHDNFAEIAAVCVTLASATSIAGRNYGSPRMVMIFIATMTWPISLGFILRGDIYHVLLGLLSVPFLFAIKRYADLVRDVLFSALSEEQKANNIAQRFNRALNTMSHGLVMLGPDGRVVVANAEAAALMLVENPEKLMGRSIRGMLLRGVAGGMLSIRDCRYIEAQLTRALREGKSRKVLVSLANGQHYEFSAREGSQELGVITFEDVTQRVEAEEKIRFMARYDSLTGLPNRAYFHELVSERMAVGDRDRLCGIAVIDMDDFKSVNDTLGHPVGDGLIYAVAERIQALEKQDIVVCRFGGDEFMIYVDSIADADQFSYLLDNAFSDLHGWVDVAGHSLRIQVSGGAVLGTVGENDVDGMIVKADLALHKAKELGKNGWRLFETVMDEAFRKRQAMKVDLRHAVETKALRVVFQPIVSMNSMRIVSCEALCRWDHPQLGPISPAVFIPLAEEIGIISDISTFVLEAACHECCKWPDPIGVSVNLSANDFRSGNIVDKVRDALETSGLSADRLEIEVTETVLLDEKYDARGYIEGIRALGVNIALDDFGTGYSSLSYLNKLPLDKIKIDRSFLLDIARNERALHLLKGIVALSRPLGLAVTVEGVETFEQLKVLAKHVKPDLVQGFLFGAALSPLGIETMSATTWPFASEVHGFRHKVSA
ncbi:putative bifunctional diguanylate cyclase/phosphodiesterase [Oryzicola mucosus]|uniref:EAL domain-containing protein n=1 Tax=Oryzicola mucosus TaxID=2767425 RepID=A0A8J6U4H8_9HYPH|nr:EAL domain-containing protein [Oryzicola mucosus]